MSGDIAFSAGPSEPGRASVVDMSLEPLGTKPITKHCGTTEPDIDNSNLDERARPADLWERIRNGFAMAELDSTEVRDNEDFYETVHNI